MSNQQQIDIAKATLAAAVKAQEIARTNVDALNASLAEWRKRFDEAKKVLDGAKPAISIAKAQLQKADADVTIARAELAKVAPAEVSNGKGANQSDVCAAVVRILKASAAPMDLDAIFARLQAEGVEMAGEKARANLTAYIGRWSKVPGSELVSAGRGLWTVKRDGAEVPSFLAPTAPPEQPTDWTEGGEQKPGVPAFLTDTTPVEKNDASTPIVLNPDFPGYAALTEAGFTTVESLAGKTHDQLRRIKGVGSGTAKEILAALEA